MAKCDVCGTEYDKAFQVAVGGRIHTFDSFECAMSMLTPSCSQCGCISAGEMTEHEGRMFCAHCAPLAKPSGMNRVAHCA